MGADVNGTGITVAALSDIELAPMELPGGNQPVAVGTVVAAASGATTMLVRFPPGWERPDAYWYEAPEEFFVLEGTLRLGDVEVGPGMFMRIEARATRRATSTPDGALCLARFDGRPVAHRGEAPADDAEGA